MIIKNLRKNDDGSYDFDFKVTDVEAEFLMDHAIKDLIRAGIIKINEEATLDFNILDREEGDTLQ